MKAAGRRVFRPDQRAVPPSTYATCRLGLEHGVRSSRPGAELGTSYRPTSEPYLSRAGTLEHWLTERYCPYAKAPDGSVWRNDVHHHPWPLQSASAEIEHNALLQTHGISVQGPPALLHFARRLDVVVWNAERAA